MELGYRVYKIVLVGYLSLAYTTLGQTISVHPVSQYLAENPLPAATLEFTKSNTGTLPEVITVDDSQRFQRMDGFGASLTDSSAWLLHDELSPELRAKTMRTLFDPKSGAGLSFLRQPFGATDLSRTHYSYDDMPSGQIDESLQHFSIAHDKPYILPTILEALRINPKITVMATPWSAPGWMKTKDSMNGGSLREDAMGAYAKYLVKSVQSYQAAGIPIHYLSVQNEPLYETSNYPGTLMQAAQQKRFIGDYLGPAMEKAHLSAQILAYDHNWDHPEYPLEVLSYPPAAKYVAGSAMHCYGGDVEAQGGIHDKYPNKGIWLTECSGGTWQKGNLLAVTSHLIIEATRNWAQSVVLWGIALDTEHGPFKGGCGTCRGLVEVNRENSPHTVSFTIDFYAMQAASRYVYRGATRIASSQSGREGLETVAFQNPNRSIALLVFNNYTEAKPFTLRWHEHQASATIGAGSLVTYVWK